jgi:hypothetical protein
MDIGNQFRGYAFFLSVIRGQQADPFCRSCNSFVKTLAAVREGLEAFERQNAGAVNALSPELVRLFSEARAGIAALRAPDQPQGQKKAGNCKLPEGVCFLKTSLALLQKI